MTTSLSHRRNTTFAPPPRRGPSLPWRQGVLLAPTLALLAAMLVASPALSALRIGTDGAGQLVGTIGADELTGKADNDLLRGLAGNDIYFFRDSWGLDTLDDRATYVVGGKRVSGGVDTLNFARTTRGVSGYMN